ncbi:MAG: hypothetical protein E6Q97_08260 [Desulfurellales bacterium]|nr:MAG: hypothetical protein E6Q97_08260 [Desulfurellales bacterium]
MAERDDATLYGAEQTGGKMEILETRTKATRDDWGFPGVATYNRLSDFNHGGFAHVRMSDTSSGHGWAGTMHRNEWEAIK